MTPEERAREIKDYADNLAEPIHPFVEQEIARALREERRAALVDGARWGIERAAKLAAVQRRRVAGEADPGGSADYRAGWYMARECCAEAVRAIDPAGAAEGA